MYNHGYVRSENEYRVEKDKNVVEADGIIDDNYNHVMGFHNRGKLGLLLTKPWNTKYDYKNRYKNWKEIIKYFGG